MNTESVADLLNAIAGQIRTAQVFGPIEITGWTLLAKALPAEVNAQYYLELATPHTVNLGLRSPDRWVSESIEADLVHTGDSLDELLEDELVDLGCDLQLKVEHFRDEAKLYTFRSQVSWQEGVNPAGLLTKVLLAYEATFRQLGDLKPEEN